MRPLPRWSYPLLALSLVLGTVAFRGTLNAVLDAGVHGDGFPWFLPTAATTGGTVAAHGLLVGLQKVEESAHDVRRGRAPTVGEATLSGRSVGHDTESEVRICTPTGGR